MSNAQTTECSDCGKPVSFSAKSCPSCGSTEPTGPYRFSTREARRFRIEQRNDRNMIVVAAVLGGVGALYGVGTSATTLGAIMAGALYGFAGVCIGVPLAFAINILRFWR